MKKRILLLSVIAGMAYLTLSSSSTGAGHTSDYNCTGAETGLTNPTGCSAAGFACHSTAATAGITLSIELDSAGAIASSTTSGTGHYKPGFTYTVKITGTNTTSYPLPRFGFQAACISGSSHVTTPVNAGSWGTVAFPLQRTAARSTYFVCNLVEHSAPIAATTLGGATGGTYVVSFPWTAPATGTGTVSVWSALNAVNYNAVADAGDLWNTNHIVLNELPAASSVAPVRRAFAIKAFPNPVSSSLNLQFEDAPEGRYTLTFFDLSGTVVGSEYMDVNNATQICSVNTGSWAPGFYQIAVEKDGGRQVIRVVKN